MMRSLAAFRAHRRRMRVTGMALLALLFQQLALSAYACPTADTPLPRAVMPGCSGMELPDADDPALCHQHCAGDHATGTELKAAKAPPLELIPWPAFMTRAWLPPVQTGHYQDVPTCRSDPPPRHRFCSLLI